MAEKGNAAFHHLLANTQDAKDEESFLEGAAKCYKEFCMQPIISNGALLSFENDGDKTHCILTTMSSQKDAVNSEVVKFNNSLTVDVDWAAGIGYSRHCGFPSLEANLVLHEMSKDGKLKAIIRKTTKKDNPVFMLEVWSANGLKKALNLTDLDLHGDIYSDVTFSSLKWSADCKKLVYVAEEKKKAGQTFFELKKDPDSMNTKEEPTRKGEKYLYEEDWGEQKIGLFQSTIVVVDVWTDKVCVVDDIPKHIAAGQPTWGPLSGENQSLIFTGWWKEPFKLGLVYCENRRSAIFQAKFNGSEWKCSQLSADNCAAYSPCMSPNGSKLVFLERDEGGPHRGCERLMMCDFKDGATVSTAYDIVQTASDSSIPLYCHSLNPNCWVNEDVVILQTAFYANQILVMLDLSSSKLHQITFKDGCWSLLDAKEHYILACYSSPVVCKELVVGKVVSAGKIVWVHIQSEISQPNRFLSQHVKWEKFALDFNDGSQVYRMESILVCPSNSSSQCRSPLIVWPHGGPHSSAVASYNSYPYLFAYLGFAVLLVNYRGSTGAGEKSLRGLLGKVGSQDVEDVQAFAEAAIQTGRFHADQIFAFGGSHGGFLGCHLVSKYPDFYRACSLRNPVINIAAMVETTDIPDWCYVESGLKYSQDVLPTPERYSSMLAKSPIVNAEKIKCPVQLLIGGKDLRVPPQQGRSLYRALKAMKKVVKMHWYPEDSHPLDQVETEGDVFVNVVKWFFIWLPRNS